MAQQNLVLLLAACPTFQVMVSAADADQALVAIHHDEVTAPDGTEYTLDELQTLRPFAVVWTSPEGGGYQMQKTASGVGSHFMESGELILTLEDDVPEEIKDHPAEVSRRFLNNVGQIVREMADRAGDDYLNVNRMAILNGPRRAHEDIVPTEGDFQIVTLSIGWGV